MPFAIKKPIKIEYFHCSTLLSYASNNWKLLPEWVKADYESGNIIFLADSISINTLEGTMIAEKDDFVIRGIKGEIYPIKSDIFKESYDLVD